MDRQAREIHELRAALAQANGSAPKAADILGISRMTVWRRMKKYGITVQQTKVVVVEGVDYPDLVA